MVHENQGIFINVNIVIRLKLVNLTFICIVFASLPFPLLLGFPKAARS